MPRPRKWYRLHASTWVVVLVAVAVLVLLVAPGAYTDLGAFYGTTIYQYGWPWSFLEETQYHDYGDEEKIPWLLEEADGDVAWGLLAADASCALGIAAAVSATWEWRRRRRERLWHVTISELLLATLAVAGILGWWQMNVREAARQRSVAYGLIQDAAFEAPVGHDFLGPVWLYRLTGQRPVWLHRISYFYVPDGAAKRQPSADIVRSIGTLTHIETLDLENLAVAEGELAPLRSLSRLSRFGVSAGKIDERNGEVLVGLAALRDLS